MIQSQTLSDLIGAIQVTHRTLDDLMRAHQRIDLQIKAVERAQVALDKHEDEGAISHSERVNREAGMAYSIDGLDLARQVFKPMIRQKTRELARLGSMLPVHAWQKDVRGFGEVGLARIVAECGDLSGYAGPAKVWKRMGVAVIDGERQRKVTGAAALTHGYVPRRAAIMFNIGESLLKTNDGAYRETYLRRKLIEQEAHPEWLTEKTVDRVTGKSVTAHPKHYHNRARRYMVKLLLKDLWQSWRDAGEMLLAPGLVVDEPDELGWIEESSDLED
jgi:hypothetical protein